MRSSPTSPATPSPRSLTCADAFSDRMTPQYVEEDHQMTARALFVGCGIGTVVQASNIYLGLKTGFTFGPQLLGGIGE